MTTKQICELNKSWVALHNAGGYHFDADLPDSLNLARFSKLLQWHTNQMEYLGYSGDDINSEINSRCETFSKKHPFK